MQFFRCAPRTSENTFTSSIGSYLRGLILFYRGFVILLRFTTNSGNRATSCQCAREHTTRPAASVRPSPASSPGSVTVLPAAASRPGPRLRIVRLHGPAPGDGHPTDIQPIQLDKLLKKIQNAPNTASGSRFAGRLDSSLVGGILWRGRTSSNPTPAQHPLLQQNGNLIGRMRPIRQEVSRYRSRSSGKLQTCRSVAPSKPD